MKLTRDQKDLRRRVIEMAYDNHFSHLGSSFSAIDIIHAIYAIKREGERFVLSSGHAALALYAVLEKHNLLNASPVNSVCIHPDRESGKCIDVSTGSLGQGLPIALGMALADRARRVYCVISDGECAEGSIWEALRVALEQKAGNLKIIVNANGWGAYTPISLPLLLNRIKGFGYKAKIVDGHNVRRLKQLLITRSKDRPLVIFAKTRVEQLPFLKGQDAHYYTMTSADFALAGKILS